MDDFLQLRSGEFLEHGAADHRRWKQPSLLLLAAALTMLAYAADVGRMSVNLSPLTPTRAQQAVTLAPGIAAAMLPGRFDPAVEQLSFSGLAMQTASVGTSLYSEMCAICHGPGGEGGIGPSLVEDPLSVEVVVAVVTSGRNAMPAFGTSLGADEIEAVALYIESLGSSPVKTTVTASTALPGPAAADLFVDLCARCHGPRGAGGAPIGPPLHLIDIQFDDVVAVVSEGRGLMPSFSETLEEAEIEDVALYAVSLEAENAALATLSPTASAAEIFAFECSGCHGVDGEGGDSPRLVDRSLSPDQVVGVITGSLTTSPHFGERLDSGRIEVLGTFVAGLGTPEEPEEEEPTGSRADLTPVVVYLCLVALVALGLLVDYFRIQARYLG